MQELNNGLGDLKKLTFTSSANDPPNKATAPPERRRKLAGLILVIGLTWAALHVILQAILPAAPVRR
ncbi:hypothetical protein [Burkholderia ambifaria]|uniref:hypothetical protein n=1 Tax=Burkholderia ambifaria TaxID=152480 RepID=UPI0015883B9C|nr:hypothetical protein [Burkholderia ambifaria]